VSGSVEIGSGSVWRFSVGDLVGYTPSRGEWDDAFYFPNWPVTAAQKRRIRANSKVVGVIVEAYEKYGYYSSRYYRIKWSDMEGFSNERHEDLVLIATKSVQYEEE
jgi:hypothetical protein